MYVQTNIEDCDWINTWYSKISLWLSMFSSKKLWHYYIHDRRNKAIYTIIQNSKKIASIHCNVRNNFITTPYSIILGLTRRHFDGRWRGRHLRRRRQKACHTSVCGPCVPFVSADSIGRCTLNCPRKVDLVKNEYYISRFCVFSNSMCLFKMEFST